MAFVLFVRDKYTINIFWDDIDWAFEQADDKQKAIIME
jgi:hypothetical protein